MNEKRLDASVHQSSVLDIEKVVRILHQEWLVRGKLQLSAFALQPGETYISVNRPSVDSYESDVRSFLTQHMGYKDKENRYCRAVLGVDDIRSIKVDIDGSPLAVDVEVEPRAKHTKSHAGIFTRYEGKNVKTGQTIKVSEQLRGVSSDDILLDVRLSLLDIASVESCNLTE